MKELKKNIVKRCATGIIAGSALIIAALPVYAETASQSGRGMQRGNHIEALVENGTISQETYDSIQSHLEANRPAEVSGRGNLFSEAVTDGIIDQDTADKLQEYMESKRNTEKPAEGGHNRLTRNNHTEMWSSLLSEGIITQEEHDAIVAGIKTPAPKGSTD